MGSKSAVRIDRPAAVVFDVLCDPTTYPDWLVAAQRTVDVDDDWPAVGATFKHRIGWGPIRMPGSTTVRRVVPDQLLELSAGMGILGEAVVTFRLDERDGATNVSVEEQPHKGLVGALERIARPIVSFALWGRNQASLDTLKRVVTRSDNGRT